MYQAGYAAVPLPGFLVNIAQCQRRLGDLKTARATYREFVLVAPDSRLVPEVETLIKQLDTLIADLASGGSGETAGEVGAGGADVHATDPSAPPLSLAPAAPRRAADGGAGARRRPGAGRHRDTAASLARPLVALGRHRGRGRRRRRGDGNCAVVTGDDDDPRRDRWGRSAARTETMRFTFDRRKSILVAVVSAVVSVAACRARGRFPRRARSSWRSSLAPGAQTPDEVRLFVYDDTGALWSDVRVPAQGPLVPQSATELGTILIQPGVTVGDLRVDLRGLSSGALVDEGTLKIPAASARAGPSR